MKPGSARWKRDKEGSKAIQRRSCGFWSGDRGVGLRGRWGGADRQSSHDVPQIAVDSIPGTLCALEGSVNVGYKLSYCGW